MAALAISIHAPSRERLPEIRGDYDARYFNPRSLAGATSAAARQAERAAISIHAPSRERQNAVQWQAVDFLFQSTLPRGSDSSTAHSKAKQPDFNPRSLAGATVPLCFIVRVGKISIHAPSRERHRILHLYTINRKFQSTLPRGSDALLTAFLLSISISIHAPSRERPAPIPGRRLILTFQSTLPRGSDSGAKILGNAANISIHAPSRERRRMGRRSTA